MVGRLSALVSCCTASFSFSLFSRARHLLHVCELLASDDQTWTKFETMAISGNGVLFGGCFHSDLGIRHPAREAGSRHPKQSVTFRRRGDTADPDRRINKKSD